MTINASTIASAIRETAMRFYIKTEVRPTWLYLGRLEDHALTDHGRPFLRFDLPRDLTTPTPRRTWEGMEILNVDADSHLQVGSPDFPTKQ